MCGIVGYVGPRDAGPILLDGLARLEYRGYDSAGIALVTCDGEHVRGEARRQALEPAHRAARRDADRGRRAWPTRAGRPTAGPTTSTHTRTWTAPATVTVIHNGIIENFRELREGLTDARPRPDLARPTRRRWPTSSRRPTTATSPTPSGRRFGRRDGAYAIAVLHRCEPGRLIGARRNVPLIVGIGDGESFIASDVAALLPHTRRVVFLEDGDVADLRSDALIVTGVDGEPRERLVSRIDWSVESAQKDGYEHFMLKEMYEQPAAIRAATMGHLRDGHVVLDELEPVLDAVRRAERVEFVACGSANYASAVAAHVFQEWTGLPARWNIGSEFRYSPPPLDERTLVVAVTQSGETADTLAPVRLARERGCTVIAVTNTVGSAVTRDADAVLFLQAGPEIAVVATKTFVTQVTTLILLAAAVATARGRMPAEREAELVAGFRELPEKAERALELAAPAAEFARRYINARGFMFVGRGITYPVALEGALKLKEVSYVHAEGYAAGELKHGPISLLDAEVPLVAVATRSAVLDKLLSNVMEGRARDARVLAVATFGDERMRDFADDILWVPETLEVLSPILAIMPLQLFAYHTAVARGTDVDQPRNLAKSVTVE